LEQAQAIQRDRSVLEQKLVEFENQAATIEEQLRLSGTHDKELLASFLDSVNVKNELTRRENELHLAEVYLQLLDDQDQIERDLRYLIDLPSPAKTAEHRAEEERLIVRKFGVVNRRDALLTQFYEDRRREDEGNRQVEQMLRLKGMGSTASIDHSFLTIESLLEPEEDEPAEEVVDSPVQTPAATPKIKRKKRKKDEDNIMARLMKGIHLLKTHEI